VSLRKQVGSLFIVGLEGTAQTPTETAWLRMLQPSGVILFRRNIETPAQVKDLLTAFNAATQTKTFRCVDVEGGLVDRLRDMVAPMPSAAAVASAKSRKLSLEHGRLIGEELSLLGLNTTFAPVLDLALPVSAHVMRTRVAGRTAQDVIEYAEPFLQGLRKSGVLGCGKHFPGLGGGALDSHAKMPAIDRGWEQLWSEDLLPFRKLHRKLPFLMVSHGAYPRVKGSSGPASLSKFWITDVLRREIGYRGLILSDDLEMGGVLGEQSIAEASIAAIAAGTHIIEVCKEPALILQSYEAVLAEAEHSRTFRRKVERAAAHVQKHKRRLLRNNQLHAAATSDQLQSIRRKIELFTAKVQKSIDRSEVKRQRSTQ
jgi:beta-N-acetylhexosaminidase